MRNRIIYLVFLMLGMTVQAQDKFQGFGEVTTYNGKEFAYTLDLNYRLGDHTSISSWNSITEGRSEAQGYNYMVTSILFNIKSKNFKNTLSVGYGQLFAGFQDGFATPATFENDALIVKVRVKLF